MKCVEGRLAEYRRKGDGNSKVPNRDAIHEKQFRSSENVSIQFTAINNFINILLKPVRLWSCFYYHYPHSCIVFTVLSWLLAQWCFTYIEFGLVFFLFSLFVFLFINLGKRKSGELSAYSIFNPHCERLPGTLTAEHFERDLLKRKILRV
ncbi:Uncharacterized protein BM_BM2176 [Brugia malayi]|uniref:Bm2176 n=2 Tax=Brugia TaxID=6278 RepID=A0A0J9XZR5_BRUMA|nr:Uncharacterized protein BM_BM2176 [Brugia malayi]CDP98744.1 Bm2176 [Brugia malayi]VIO98707.1 Uncharacterized protein BM_BM2176 [Brugia malayi]